MTKRTSSKTILLIIVLLCLISRLPQLLSENLFLDGDECIVGLMAKHFLEGQETPYFFYGQSYGFALIEVISIRIFYSIFEITDVAVKLSMLSLWTVGIVLFYKTIEQLSPQNNKWLPFLVTLVFISSPAWAIWSMKARGGYLTAFTLTWLVTFLLFNQSYNKSFVTLSIIGLLITTIYYSQPLWLAGLIPIIGYHIYKTKPLRSIITISISIGCGILIFHAIKPGFAPFTIPQALSFSNFSLELFCNIPTLLYKNLTGSYLYADYFIPAFAAKLWAIVFSTLVFLTLGAGIYYLLSKKVFNPLFYIFCLSVLCTIGYLLFTHGAQFRYLLPLTGYALLLFYTAVITLNNKLLLRVLLVFLVFTGAISLHSFKDNNFERTGKKDLLNLIEELESRNIHNVYCKDGLLQWQIMFYSQERIIARYSTKIDRYQKYIEQVDSAFKSANKKVAMVGFFDPSPNYPSSDILPVNNRYLIYLNPSKEALLEHNFEI